MNLLSSQQKRKISSSFIRAFFAALTLIGFSIWWSPSAHAGYQLSYDWPSMKKVDLVETVARNFTDEGHLLDLDVSEQTVRVVLNDYRDRVDPNFRIPPGMRNQVAFWLRIYTKYTTHHTVLFDERHPEIVYEVIDFRDLQKREPNPVRYEIYRRRKTLKVLKAYQKAFRSLAARKNNTSKKHLTREEKRILQAHQILSRKRHPHHEYSYFAKHLRTTTGQRDGIMRGLATADLYFERMEEIFAEMQLPRQLTRLALVESSFNFNAVSRVGATGVWQFMPGPGQHYMTISHKRQIDERLSPIKSTVAAARLLLDHQKIFRSRVNWPIVITSYNYGLRTLLSFPPSATNLQSLGKLFSGCEKTNPDHRLGFAGRNYYASFLAVLHAESYREFFFGPTQIQNNAFIAYKKIERPQSLLGIALQEGVPLRLIQRLNPDVQNSKVKLPKGFWVALPARKKDSFEGLYANNESRRSQS